MSIDQRSAQPRPLFQSREYSLEYRVQHFMIRSSLGCAAIFLIGGKTRDSEPTPILLRSGDVVIMSGPVARRAYHGVPRILEDTLPPHLQDCQEEGWEPFKAYLKSTRINVNVRQVFPMSFDAEQVLARKQ
jgi:alkylated DNA repair protein alkB homolog 1